MRRSPRCGMGLRARFLTTCAIGIVRMSGGKAIEIADRLFSPVSGRKMADCEDRKLIYGKLCDEQGRLLDICLCTISRAPNSYTGEDTAEFQCHGSPVVLRAVLEAAFSLGARQALPGEFTKRAFLNGRMDLSGAEAVADIIDAQTAEWSNFLLHSTFSDIAGARMGVREAFSVLDLCQRWCLEHVGCRLRSLSFMFTSGLYESK